MIIERYLLREVLLTFVGVTVLLMLIFLSGTFVRILAETLEGDYPVTAIFSLFGLKALANLVLVLPLAFFLGVMLALGRLYKDSEMVAMVACGIGPRRILAAVGVISLLVALIAGGLALYMTPWAEEKGHQILDVAKAGSKIEGLAPGKFTQVGEDAPLVYLKEMDVDSKTMRELFVHGRDKGKQHLLTAKRAYQSVDKETGVRYLVLEDGYRYEGNPGEADFKIIHFREHGIYLPEREVVASKRRRNAIPSAQLFASQDRGDIAEWHWRLSVPISTVLLGLLAVMMSKTTPRQGRFGKLFIGILVVVIYNNLLTVARSSLAGGEVPVWMGLWWAHILLILLVWMLYWRQGKMGGDRRRRRAPA